jgi:bifunctional non-homologous end joining protein LigD
MRLARLAEPWHDPDWIFELKYDGFRSLAYVGPGRTRLVSRRIEYGRYAELARSIAGALRGHEAYWTKCLSRFGQARRSSRSAVQPHCTLFCCVGSVVLDGEDLRGLPMLQRKRKLREFHGERFWAAVCRSLDGRGVDLFRAVPPVIAAALRTCILARIV